MLKLLTKLVKIVLILVLLLIGSIFAYQKGWIRQHPLQKQLEQLEIKQVSDLKNIFQGNFNNEETKESLNNLSQDAGKQIKNLSEKALEAGEVTQGFIQEAIQVNEEEEKNISEKAFEYGRYVYCQQVVEDWEESHQSNDEPSASESATETIDF